MVCIIVLSLGISLMPSAFAERNIDFQKVIDMDMNSLQNYFEEPQNLKNVFPENIKSIKPIKYSDVGNLLQMSLDLNGIKANPQVLFKESNNKYFFRIIEGSLKGTTVTTTLQKTWGFDGTADAGTIVNVKTKIHTSGLLSLVNWIPDNSILYTIDYALLGIISDAKGEETIIEEKIKNKGRR